MLFDFTYKEITANSQGLYKEKGSKFIAYAYSVYDLDSIKKYLKEIKNIESSASHYCYAYRLYPDKSLYKFNDDGEPAYTAGKPIFKQIEKCELTNILIIVVRYFGGVKLGVPGLIRSYKTATINVLKNSNIIIKTIKDKYIVFFQPEHMNDVMRLIKHNHLEIIKTDFQQECSITFLVDREKTDLVLNLFKKNHHLRVEYH